MVGAIAEGSGNNLFAMLRATQEKQEESLDQTALASPVAAAADTLALSREGVAASSNMMSGNFASAQKGESRYLSALKDGFAVDEQIALSRNEVITASVAKAIAESAYWNGNERMRRAKMMKDNAEANEGNLQEVKDTIEQQAAESVAGSSGEPGTAGGTQQGQAPAPELSAPTPGPTPESIATPVPSGPAPALEVAAPSVPSAPSLNITV